MVKTLLTSLLLLFSSVAFSNMGVELINNPPRISVFPNPTSDYFAISDSENISQLLVFNLVGKEMRKFEVTEGEKYDIGDLPNGMYLIQFIGKDRKIINTQRIRKR